MVKPAPEQSVRPDDLLQTSVGWVAAALVQELSQPLAAIRANVQAARRLLARDGPDNRELAAALADLLEDTDLLGSMVSALRAPLDGLVRKTWVEPEREIRLTVGLLSGPGSQLTVVADDEATAAWGRPGAVGVAVLHLLLSLPSLSVRTVHVTRSANDRLLVEILGGGVGQGVDYEPATARALHAAAATTVIERLGGRLDLAASAGPRFEVVLTRG